MSTTENHTTTPHVLPTTDTGRRQILKGIVGGVIAGSLPGAAWSATAQPALASRKKPQAPRARLSTGARLS